MNPVNINFDRPQFDKTNSARNIEVMNRWIADTSDKLNYLTALINAGEIRGDIPSDALETIRGEIVKMQETAFESSDTSDGKAAAWTSVKPLESNEKKRSILEKTSQMFRNVRYLFKVIGTSDISSIGDGTATGAISALNSTVSAHTNGIDSLNQSLAKLYPVGSIYLSVNDTDPGTFIGGTWERIKDKFLLAAGDTYAAGSSGGEAEHTHKYGIQFGAYYGSVSIESDSQSGVLQGGVGNPAGSVYNTSANSIINNNATNGSKTISASHYKSTADTSSASNMPPYLAVYVWKRTA